MRHASIRVRLTACFSGILAVTLAVAGIGARWALRESIHDTVDKDLRERLAGMRAYLSREGGLNAAQLADELAESGALAPAGTRFRIADKNGAWIYQASGTGIWEPIRERDLSARRERVRMMRPNGKPFRVLTAPLAVGSIQIGTPLGEYYEMLDGFTWTALLASPLLLLLSAAGGYWMSRRALAPVDVITGMARDIGARDLSRRLPLRGSGDELDRLSETLNGMFARLESAFERITRFTADASHELRTPVAVIRATAELARNKPRTGEQYEQALDRILCESERVSALIDDLLLLARADAGADQLARELVDLAGVLSEVCEETRVLAQSRGVALRTQPFPDAAVQGDAPALHRLVLVILENAIKYTPSGGTIQVSMETVSDQVYVAIQDTGIGISSEDLPHIFDRFRRASKDRSRQAGGTGLGLAIAQWIAGRHAGEVTVRSEVNVGSTFTLRLPAASAPIQNPPAESGWR